MSWEGLLGALPLLVFLACPIAMCWMMRGTGGGACGKADAGPRTAAAEGVVPLDENLSTERMT